MATLRSKVSAATVSPECCKLTIVKLKGTADISPGAFSNTPGVWESLNMAMFLARLELLRGFFGMCGGAVKADNVGQMMPSGDMLVRPVK